MAAASRELYYRQQGAVVGDLAFDLDRQTRERNLRRAGEAGREAALPKVRSVSHVQTRERQRVSVVAVLGFFAVAVLAVFVLMGYAKLTAMSFATVDLQADLKKLNTENVSLTAQYEKMYDLSTVKERAAAEGMSKPARSQIYYVDLSGGDTAEVYEKQEPGILRRLLASIHNGFYAVVEYLD